jgi:tetratricopeptide (TPR) repeat protein
MLNPIAVLLSATVAFSGTAAADDSSPDPTIPPDASCDQAIAQLEQFEAFAMKANGSERDLRRARTKAAASADAFNAFGMRCPTLGHFKESVRLFNWAVQVDPKHVLAHYNLACAYAQARERFGPCDMGGIDMVLVHLQKAIELDPKRAKRVATDLDLDSVRDYFNVRLLSRGAPTTATEMAALFDGIVLWGPTPGIYTLAEIEFGRTHPTALTGTVEGYAGMDENMKGIPTQGTWRATADSIIIDWVKRDHPEIVEEEKLTQRIRVVNGEQWGLLDQNWFGIPDECGA